MSFIVLLVVRDIWSQVSPYRFLVCQIFLLLGRMQEMTPDLGEVDNTYKDRT